MSLLTPVFLLLGFLALPLVALYMLRLRRRELQISSTMLWLKLLRDREANVPWQKLQRNLLLFLQLLILGALVLALARPFLPSPSVVSGSVVVILDGSASMLATDVTPSRFAVARQKVAQLISDLGGRDRMTLILAGSTPTVLISATGDKNAIRRVLDKAQARPVVADWEAAFALSAGAIQGFQEGRVVLISDGGLPTDLPPMPAEIIYISVGDQAENLAITALAARDSSVASELFVGVDNYGLMDRQALVSIKLGSRLLDSRQVESLAGETTTLIWDLPADANQITAHISSEGDDFLALDDTAWTIRQSRNLARTLIVGEGNRFLETALSVIPGLDSFRVEPGHSPEQAGDQPFDLYVYDSVSLPDPIPDSDLLLINPMESVLEGEGNTGLSFNIREVFSETATVKVADDPLMDFVEWGDVNVLRAKQVDAPWAKPLVVAEGGPLLLAGELSGRRIVIFTFKLQESDLPLQIAFPVLMANIIGWLNPGQFLEIPNELNPGDPVAIAPRTGTTAVTIQKPDSSVWTAPISDEAMVFAETDQLGLYQLKLRELSGDEHESAFAVNLFAPAESAIRPSQEIQIGQAQVDTLSEDKIGQRELWPWLAVVAFTVLLVEWWIYHYGMRMPRSLAIVEGLARISRRKHY